MGGEGITWTGMAPFTNTNHIFQNLGDGTYTHSGSLAVRAAVQSGANITYKILYNDAAAMTGGQPVEGSLTVAEIAEQMHAEGVKDLAIVSDQPEKFRGLCDLPAGTRVHHRDELDAVQRRMRDIPGTTVLIYEQTCAAEKRRRRKRGAFPDPNKRAFINTLICEGCGDCSTKANCVSIHPVETPFGRKRKIDQSSCNKDYSCLEGFCPAFVTVEGGELRRPDVAELPAGIFDGLPEPSRPALDKEWSMLVAGIGGTGVVTISAVLGMAAHLEGKGVSIFDMTGLSQKNGAVYSHLKISAAPGAEVSHGVGLGEADLLLGCDLVAAVAPSALHTLEPDQTHAVVNADVTPTPAFQLARDLAVDGSLLVQGLTDHVGADHTHTVDATRIALELTGDTIGANSFMIGFALQSGCLPLSVAAIEQAIAVNGVAVPFNLLAFRLGRLAAAKPDTVAGLMTKTTERAHVESLEDMIARRADYLTAYQDADYANRYRTLVETAQRAETKVGSDDSDFATAVARNAFKVMAYKDEYEVARLHCDASFAEQLNQTFSGDFSIRHHLAPPLFARRDPHTGLPRKSAYGPWMGRVMKLLAGMKGLRGSRLDIFGRTAKRRAERHLRDRYIADIQGIAGTLTKDSLATAIALAEIP
ncbi:MAG: indolepyruvate ferredoxin oxidoreductase family protein, partial [Alphaproteobacteria bacterium]|nr:indolepyruvate ferredoxin oxidoreductase family protein [Alphaproteobacteria bacterium]